MSWVVQIETFCIHKIKICLSIFNLTLRDRIPVDDVTQATSELRHSSRILASLVLRIIFLTLKLVVFLHRVSHQFWPHLEMPNSDFNLTRALTSLEWLISPIIWSRLGSPLSTTPAAWLLLKESYLFLSKGVPLPEDNIHFLPAKKRTVELCVVIVCHLIYKNKRRIQLL